MITDFIIELKIGRRNSPAATRTLTECRSVAGCWLPFGDDERLVKATNKQPIDQDKYKCEWVALGPKTDAVLSHSRSLADADGQAIEQGTTPVVVSVPESDGYFVGQV